VSLQRRYGVGMVAFALGTLVLAVGQFAAGAQSLYLPGVELSFSLLVGTIGALACLERDHLTFEDEHGHVVTFFAGSMTVSGLALLVAGVSLLA
jgi:hypothetical protein